MSKRNRKVSGRPEGLSPIRAEGDATLARCETAADLQPTKTATKISAAEECRLRREGAIAAMRPTLELAIPEWKGPTDAQLEDELASYDPSCLDSREMGRMTAEFVRQMRESAKEAAQREIEKTFEEGT